jgi:hypothetical protein
VGTAHQETGAAEGVALDIGDGVGALVVNASPEFLGREVEVAPSRSGARRMHAVVHERRAGSSTMYAAVFDSLAEGHYDLWEGPRAMAESVAVVGGRVSEVDWRVQGPRTSTPGGAPTTE